MAVRGIRGATTVEVDAPEEILLATRELLVRLIEENDIAPADIASAWFTTTSDLRSEFPAVAARRLGWTDVPLMCAHEMNVVDGNPRNVPRCIRVLIHVNSERSQREMRFVYLRRATTIREEVNRDRERSGEGVRTTVPS